MYCLCLWSVLYKAFLFTQWKFLYLYIVLMGLYADFDISIDAMSESLLFVFGAYETKIILMYIRLLSSRLHTYKKS